MTGSVFAWPDADTLDQRGHRQLRERLDSAGVAESDPTPPVPDEALAWAAQRVGTLGHPAPNAP
ncbi:MAG: hypothetical protein H6932_00550 [Burkholderiaceae bacterium]|nr:hypothetical protein [Burkholderiaceae bacterium]